MGNCDVRSWGQENVCITCGLRWDHNDRDVPECAGEVLPRSEVSDRLTKLKERI